MSIIESKRGHLPPQPTPALLERYGVLKNKIASKMQKIVAANREIDALDLELRRYDIEWLRFTQNPTFRSLPDIAANSWNLWHSSSREKYASDLRLKKMPFEAVKEKNHEKLARYEEAYKTEMPPLDLSPSAEDARLIEIFKEKDIHPTLHYIGITLPCISLTKYISIGLGANPEFIERQDRAQKLFEKAMSCRAIRELYMEAMLYKDPTNRTGSWSLFFRHAHEDKCPNELIVTRAYTCGRMLRTIVLHAQLDDIKALALFIFELTNAASSLRWEELYSLARQRKIGREEFAKGAEAIEHDGALKCLAITTAAIAELGWPASLKTFEARSIDFESWWKCNNNKFHTQLYRKQWDRM
ncbi:MAG: hypothetical protein ABSA17_08725 [Rhabdochlamydiaceae bacterium]|jgi:hypothetical protein